METNITKTIIDELCKSEELAQAMTDVSMAGLEVLNKEAERVRLSGVILNQHFQKCNESA